MPSFQTTASVFHTRFKSPTKYDFVGTLFPATERDVKLDEVVQNRLFLRVDFTCPVDSGDEMLDDVGRRFLLADFDETPTYRVHRAIRLTDYVPWTRTIDIVDPVTQLPRGTSTPNPLGPIWVAFENVNRQERDSVLNVQEDVKRIVCRHPLQLGDKVNGYIIKRLDFSLGITIAEAQ